MTGDADRQVQAVLNVLAPYVDGIPPYGPVRFPLFMLDYDGVAVRPSDEQVAGLARAIVTAVRTASGEGGSVLAVQQDQKWRPRGAFGWQRDLPAGAIAVVDMSDRGTSLWTWAILTPGGGGWTVTGSGPAVSAEAARASADTAADDTPAEGTD
jgi:hypothetical protein